MEQQSLVKKLRLNLSEVSDPLTKLNQYKMVQCSAELKDYVENSTLVNIMIWSCSNVFINNHTFLQ